MQQSDRINLMIFAMEKNVDGHLSLAYTTGVKEKLVWPFYFVTMILVTVMSVTYWR